MRAAMKSMLSTQGRQEGLVHSLFENIAFSSPNAVAVQYDSNKAISYEELNCIANIVARQLVCGRGHLIPILVQRSPELIIAMIAVMKAGAAYIVLSPDSPHDRNEYIVKDTNAPFVITDQTTFGSFSTTPEIRIDQLHASSATSRIPSHNLDIWLQPKERAYVIYTSGTTGKPKGVLLSHQAAYSGLIALPNPEPSQPLRQLLCHSPNFSAAQRTILGSLVRGGTICLASKEDLTLNLSSTITAMGVTTLEITPSMLKLMAPSSIPASIKKINLGGEVVSPSLVESYGHRFELTNAYGLSECTQLNMRHTLVPGQSSRLIGRPTDSTSAFILRPGSTELIHPGESGELCLAGPQIADGYLNLPEKTNKAFLPSPFGNGAMYRTGDMAILHLDGSFELIGRVDHQTKIDGQRVDPEEPNAILESSAAVNISTVVAANVLDRQALVAVVVPFKGADWPSLVRQLRAMLRKELPPYAVPSFWVMRDNLPFNVSGKVDVVSLVNWVESLPEYELVSRSITPKVTPPLTPARTNSPDHYEATLTSMVAETLSMSQSTVDLDCSFQELGGTSLKAIVLASNLKKANIHAVVSDILTSTSLRELPTKIASSEASLAEVVEPFSLLPENVRLDRRELDDAYPATPLQEGLIADSLLGKADYVYQRVYKLNGISKQQAKEALQEVIDRNSILRSSIKPWKKNFLQVVHSKLELPWMELSETSLQHYKKVSIGRSMPLNGPLLRAIALKDENLVIEMHHALFDFWSSQFLFVDAVTLLEGRQPTPRTPFNLYVAWQQRQHNEEAHEFWKQYLSDAPSSSIEFTPPESSTANQGLELPFKKSPLEFSKAQNITLGTLVHAAWALTLVKHLRQLDVVFMTAFSGRDAPVEGILAMNGPSLSTTPIRIKADPTQNVLKFIENVQKNLWNLSRYAHSGVRNILKAGDIPKEYFNTMINVLVTQEPPSETAPLLPIETHGDNYTQYPTIEIEETSATSAKFLGQQVAYSVAKLLLEDFIDAMDFIVTRPEDSLASYAPPQIENDELVQFGLAHAEFERHAQLNPSKAAICTSNGTEISYAELNGKANSFARHLSETGSTHGDMIPLYMEKSATTLISILGIMKAGAAFVPLDPKNPHERNIFIIQDVKARRVVTDRKNHSAASAFGVDLTIPDELDLDADGEAPSAPALSLDSTVYAIYTSGSTGLPKGVLVPHSAVTASTEGMIEATAVTSDWKALWVLNYVFDASYYDVFTLFSAGATICVAPQDEVLSNLSGFINDMGIQQVMLTPTITKLIKGGPSEVPGLKVLNVCGERIDTNIQKWAESIDVYNGYGPTEATILMTVSKVQPGGSLNSIGSPLKHATATIVPAEGDSLETVARGVIGELCVSGPHVAKEYLNRPEITAKSFVNHSNGSTSTKYRIYRTGDLARWNEDGTLECFGRKDYQVKLNGFRIELGEIENAILYTSAVEAVVVSVCEIQEKRQLVAFVILKGDDRFRSEGLLPAESRLEQITEITAQLNTLSHYMMPSFFLPFGKFPTLPSGKTNRKELVALVEKMERATLNAYVPSSGDADESFEPVSTDEEKIMQEAWVSVLGEDEDRVGTTTAFFGLGGDSISAINVVAECRRLGYKISVADVLSLGTLREQAKRLVPAVDKPAAAEVQYDIPLSVLSAVEGIGHTIESILPCGPGQSEFLTQGHKHPQFWNLTACRDLPPSSSFTLSDWKSITTELTRRNSILRTFYHLSSPSDSTPSTWYQIILSSPLLNWSTATYTTESEKLAHMHSLRDSTFTFGLPAIKYLLLTSSLTGTRTLCIKVDHGSYDGTLLRIFDEQFTALARGTSPQDLPPVHDFKEFIDFVAQSDKISALKYWRKALESYKPAQNLPLEPKADALKFFPVKTDVEAVANKHGVTASTVFQAAYAVLVAYLTGKRDVLVDNLVTGRNADVANPQMINGTCANFLPFRSVVQGHGQSEQVGDFLRETQKDFWESTENGTVGLSEIYSDKGLGRGREENAAKLLYLTDVYYGFCFQPFTPPPAPAAGAGAGTGSSSAVPQTNHMRWLVMAQSKVFMTINYAVMVEVQKTTAGGHRIKLQWDSRALDTKQADGFLGLFDRVLEGLGKKEGLEKVMEMEGGEGEGGDGGEMKGLWKKE